MNRLRRGLALLVVTALVCGCGITVPNQGDPDTTPVTVPQSSEGTVETTPETAPAAVSQTPPEVDAPDAAVETINSDLQLDLEQLGYGPGPVNGQFDSATLTALDHFQSHAVVPSTEQGALGPATAAALAKHLGGQLDAVYALQAALTDAGAYHDPIDGHYDLATIGAVKRLQAATGLSVDGFYDPVTAAAFATQYAREVTKRVPTNVVLPTGPGVLTLGSRGSAVAALQQRLGSLGYRPGPANGTYGAATASAVLAFEKRVGLPPDGDVDSAVQSSLFAGTAGVEPMPGSGPRIEIDIARQIAFVVLAGQSVVTLNASTGNGLPYTVAGGSQLVAATPTGGFSVQRKVAGVDAAPIGSLYDPIFFDHAWAISGAANVPAYPASYGSVRISYADAAWLYPLVTVGTPVLILSGTTPSSTGTAAAGY